MEIDNSRVRYFKVPFISLTTVFIDHHLIFSARMTEGCRFNRNCGIFQNSISVETTIDLFLSFLQQT
jgi:hypothetical protein